MSRKTAMKEYWQDVNSLKNIFGLTTKEARKKLKFSNKYALKRAERSGKEVKEWKKVWAEVKKMPKHQLKIYIKEQLETMELVS